MKKLPIRIQKEMRKDLDNEYRNYILSEKIREHCSFCARIFKIMKKLYKEKL